MIYRKNSPNELGELIQQMVSRRIVETSLGSEPGDLTAQIGGDSRCTFA
jgi:hypothetical protein